MLAVRLESLGCRSGVLDLGLILTIFLSSKPPYRYEVPPCHLYGYGAYWKLIGAFNAMLHPIHVIRAAQRAGPFPDDAHDLWGAFTAEAADAPSPRTEVVHMV